MEHTHHSTGGGVLGLLAIVLVLLKVFGKIAWSWWWVFAPLWVPLVVALLMGAGILIACFVADR